MTVGVLVAAAGFELPSSVQLGLALFYYNQDLSPLDTE